MDRRAVFFVLAAVASAALIPFVPEDDNHPKVAWIGPGLVIVLLVLAVLSLLDHLSRRKDHR